MRNIEEASQMKKAIVASKGGNNNLEERFKTADEIIQAVQQLPKPPVGEYAVRLPAESVGFTMAAQAACGRVCRAPETLCGYGRPAREGKQEAQHPLHARQHGGERVHGHSRIQRSPSRPRPIDKLLVEGMCKAGKPLTKEQGYLKEDAEKKQK